ncbi:MAG: hypothetical protein WCG05_01065 [Alphaproteobacteria bacterium]
MSKKIYFWVLLGLLSLNFEGAVANPADNNIRRAAQGNYTPDEIAMLVSSRKFTVEQIRGNVSEVKQSLAAIRHPETVAELNKAIRMKEEGGGDANALKVEKTRVLQMTVLAEDESRIRGEAGASDLKGTETQEHIDWFHKQIKKLNDSSAVFDKKGLEALRGEASKKKIPTIEGQSLQTQLFGIIDAKLAILDSQTANQQQSSSRLSSVGVKSLQELAVEYVGHRDVQDLIQQIKNINQIITARDYAHLFVPRAKFTEWLRKSATPGKICTTTLAGGKQVTPEDCSLLMKYKEAALKKRHILKNIAGDILTQENLRGDASPLKVKFTTTLAKINDEIRNNKNLGIHFASEPFGDSDV